MPTLRDMLGIQDLLNRAERQAYEMSLRQSRRRLRKALIREHYGPALRVLRPPRHVSSRVPSGYNIAGRVQE